MAKSKTKFDVTMPIMASVIGLGIFAVFRLAKTKATNPQTTADIPPQSPPQK